MEASMVYWSLYHFKVPLRNFRFTLSLLLILFVALQLSVLYFPAVASCFRPLTTSNNLYSQAIFVALLAMAFGIWSMVTNGKKEGWYYLAYEILNIFVVTFEGLLFAEII